MGAVLVSLFTGWQSLVGVAALIAVALVLTFGMPGGRSVSRERSPL
jgi:hypothetical protein